MSLYVDVIHMYIAFLKLRYRHYIKKIKSNFFLSNFISFIMFIRIKETADGSLSDLYISTQAKVKRTVGKNYKQNIPTRVMHGLFRYKYF